MQVESQRPKEREGAISALNIAIETLNLAKEVASITPAKAVFGSVSAVLVMIRDDMTNQMDYVELGLACADVCNALKRGLNGKTPNDLNNSVYEAINQLTKAVEEIQRDITKQGKRNVIFRHLNAKNDKDKIVGWRLDLVRVLNVFNAELAISTHLAVSDTRAIVSELGQDVTSTRVMVSNIHRTVVEGREGSDGINLVTQTSTLGESPPPAPRACFGRDELIKKIVGLAETLTPIALIGVGGIGKTSIALTVLHHNRVKQRFGDNRRFIRCDQFTTSCANLLSHLSKVIGAGIKNPENFASLRPFLSSKEVLIVLDNAESILDPQGVDSQEIYAVVEELSRLDNICLCITSRISTIPPDCETFEIPILSIGAARDAFYRIYKNGERTDLVDKIFEQLDFHPLCITLLATVAHHSKWDTDRLTREWEQRRTSVLQTEHSKSLAATIELSLSSAMFLELGPDARELLGIVAFFPQGVNENNLDWLFPTIPNRANVVDKFCILSLTYRSNGFITMLAPLRDYLSPKDPKSSSLLCTTRECYFTRMSVDIDPNESTFGESQWITSEDVNVEYLLDVFTTVDPNSDSTWKACANFMQHLYWHKKRPIILKPKIEGLPDNHRFKPDCLFELSRLLYSIGNDSECKRLLTHTLRLWREREDYKKVAYVLGNLSSTNRSMGLREEGIQQAKEALAICERLGNAMGQAECLIDLAWLLEEDGQFDAAEEAAFRAIDLLPEEGEQYRVCASHRALGDIYSSKGETGNAIHHFELALGIASSFNWDDHLFWVHYGLAQLFYRGGRFDDAQPHLERAKSHAVNIPHCVGDAMKLQALVWYGQHRLEDARSEALHAAEVYEKLGAATDVDECRKFLQWIEKELDSSLASRWSGSSSQGIKRWYRWLR